VITVSWRLVVLVNCGHESAQIGHDHVVDDRRLDAHCHNQFGDFDADVDLHHTLDRPDDWVDIDCGLDAHQQMTLSMNSTGCRRYCRTFQLD
jgi:hypothetical protein